MSKKLDGKIALVTRGSRGIGAAIASRLAAEGAKVVITYAKDEGRAARVVKTIEQAGGEATAVRADTTDADAAKSAVEKTVATFGGLSRRRGPLLQSRGAIVSTTSKDSVGTCPSPPFPHPQAEPSVLVARV